MLMASPILRRSRSIIKIHRKLIQKFYLFVSHKSIYSLKSNFNENIFIVNVKLISRSRSDQMQIDDSPTSNSPKLLSTLEISRDHLPLHVITLVQKQDLTLCALGGLGRYIQLLLRCK
jgi:hypothetical protein